MKIAMPISNNQLCMHFGHCETFRFFEVDTNKKEITSTVDKTPPAHEPGILPKWISEQEAKIVLAGGMGQRALNLFHQNGINVVVGITSNDPQKIVMDYLNNNLESGANVCDH